MTSTETVGTDKGRDPLTRQRVFEGAIRVADRDGIDGLTMRALADELGVEAMSLYYHVENKDAILDGVVDAIVEEIGEEIGGFDVPAHVDDWKATMRDRITGARTVMLRHKWAPAVFESRTRIGFPVAQYMHMLLGIMRKGGLSYDLAHHALHALSSRALGFSPELFEPDEADSTDSDGFDLLESRAEELPYLVEMMTEIVPHGDDPDSTLGWCDDDFEFYFGLDLILDGLEQRAATE